MNSRQEWLAMGFALAITLVTGACSDDEQPSFETTAEQVADQVPGQVTTEVPAEADESDAGASRPPDGKDWTLLAESTLTTHLAIAYRAQCVDAEGDGFECKVLRSLVVVETVMALEEIERSRDQRGTEEALAALDLTDEPEILIAALRVLGQFPDTPGIAEKAWPLLLESPYLQVQQLAARLLAANPDPTLAALGAYWGSNHSTLYVEDSYQEYPDFAPHYPGIGFPEYHNAEWFSPADSDRSVGWSTGDDFATVSAWLSAALGAEGLTYQQWGERLAQESMAVFQAIDPGKQAEMERLIEEWTATLDPAVMEKLHKLQEEMYAPVEAAGEMADKGVASLAPPLATETQEQVRFFVAEERAGHVARMVMVYPLSSLGRTVIQHAWSLADYPSAWPPTEEDIQEE